MANKRIILLSDGTGNSAGKVWRTNVWRTFESLDLTSSQQIAFYDDGLMFSPSSGGRVWAAPSASV